jgi:flagellar motor protein MotB
MYDSDELDEETQAWPAFVDLLAAMALLLLTLLAIFLLTGAIDVGSQRTEWRTLIQALENTSAHGNHYSIDMEEQQFVRLMFTEEAVFPHGMYSWATLRPQGKSALSEVGQVLRADSVVPLFREIRVIGHTDTIPYLTGVFTNWELSAMRAAVVVRYLVNEVGIDPCKISATGFGPYHPPPGLDSQTEGPAERNARKRRIEIEIVPVRSRGMLDVRPCNQFGDGSASS